MSRWPVIKAPLHAPSLDEIATVLETGLAAEFDEVSVKVINCPDLTCKPFMLASNGICGSPRLLDIGGVPYLLPMPTMEKIYDLRQVPSWSELSSTSTLIVGAGAAPAHVVGDLAELVPNIRIDAAGDVCNMTRTCKIDKKSGKYILYALNSCDSNHLTNLYISEGKPGKVVEVSAKHKKSDKVDFISCLQSSLKVQYGSRPVGLGGAFVLKKGKARIHVMPGYSEVPIQNGTMLDEWLKFFEMSSPLTCVGYLLSHDPGLCLRMEHFHCFSEHGDGGHFHYDVTPREAEYLGYFNVPEYVFRVDKFDDDAYVVGSH